MRRHCGLEIGRQTQGSRHKAMLSVRVISITRLTKSCNVSLCALTAENSHCSLFPKGIFSYFEIN